MFVDSAYILILFVAMFSGYVVLSRRVSFFGTESGFIAALYIASVAASFFLLFFDKPSVYPMSFVSVFLLAGFFFVYIYPLACFSRKKNVTLSDAGLRPILYATAWVFVLGSFFSIITLFPHAFFMLTGDIRLNRISSVHVEGFRSSPEGLTGKLVTAFAVFYGQAQVLAFYLHSSNKKIRFRRALFWLLIIGSLSYVVIVLTFAGRDGVVYWLFSIAFVSIVFNRLTSFDFFKSYKVPIFALVLVLAVPFLLITSARFGDGWLLSILAYLGQMPYHFNDFVHISPPPALGAINFRDFVGFFGVGEFDKVSYYRYYSEHGTFSWVFSYFFGSLAKDFGLLGAFVAISLFSLIAFIVVASINRNGFIYFDQVLFIYFYAQVGFMGLFYFKHSSLNNYMLMFFIVYFLSYILRKLSVSGCLGNKAVR